MFNFWHRGALSYNSGVEVQLSRILSNFSAFVMPKRKAKKAKQPDLSHVNNTVCGIDANRLLQEKASIDQEGICFVIF